MSIINKSDNLEVWDKLKNLLEDEKTKSSKEKMLSDLYLLINLIENNDLSKIEITELHNKVLLELEKIVSKK